MPINRLKSSFKRQAIEVRKSLLSNFPQFISFYYRKLWKPKPGSLAESLDRFSKSQKDVFFVQVGSNDGFQHDPLCKFIKRDHWKGLLFEPQAKAFQTLTYIYKKDNVTPINKAVDSHIHTKELYKIAFTDARWASGLSSFERKQLEQKIEDGSIDRKCKKEGIIPPANKSDYIAEELIACVTFESIFEDQKIEKVDLLQVDTEGYDFEIIKLFDFERFRPSVVIFEKTHLSLEEYQKAIEYLENYGYKMEEKGADAMGVAEGFKS